MSVLKYLLMEYVKDYMPPSVVWRERRVWHKTPTGEMNYVKIKSLPPEEQLKYKPGKIHKKDKEAEKLNKNINKSFSIEQQPVQQNIEISDKLKPKPPIEGEVFNFYYGVEDISKYDEIEKDELIIATLDSSKAIEMEEDEKLNIAIAKNVPVEAVKQYMDEKGKWQNIDIEDKEEKANFIKFDDNDYFKLDLYDYKDIVELELQDDVEDNETDLKEHELYMLEKQLLFLVVNNGVSLIKESDEVDPALIRAAEEIAEKLNIKFDGFLDLDSNDNRKLPVSYYEKYKNMAFFTDTNETRSSFSVQLKGTFQDMLSTVREKLINMRNKFGVEIA